jgi:hypothetical protein
VPFGRCCSTGRRCLSDEGHQENSTGGCDKKTHQGVINCKTVSQFVTLGIPEALCNVEICETVELYKE